MDVEQRWTVSWKITRLVLQRSDVALLNGDETLMKEVFKRRLGVELSDMV